MAQPRPPLGPGKLRRARILLVGVTAAVIVGTVVDLATGRGPWAWGLIGWAAIAAAVTLGAGRDNTLAILGLATQAQRWRERFPATETQGNDADWS